MSSSAEPPEPWAWRSQEVASVVVVCILFLILSYCSILKRLFRIATSHRNQGRRRLLDESTADDPSSVQFQSYGLEVSIINSLPMSQFKKSDEEKASNTDCAICLGEFEEGEWLKHLPNCNHVFHVSCIDTWFRSHSNCPLCRSHAHCHLTDN
ncbi:hypothetical protein L6164_019172 [Bauhinia variegata]|uniref:Uncharacterized protein n=1 Tax=Bauhinia variegata TaxID=167791 RepID=A0ACB9NH21_BAUVA|nr:hypothetical protein L6164_019172 [Bauhinia variegata]